MYSWLDPSDCQKRTLRLQWKVTFGQGYMSISSHKLLLPAFQIQVHLCISGYVVGIFLLCPEVSHSNYLLIIGFLLNPRTALWDAMEELCKKVYDPKCFNPLSDSLDEVLYIWAKTCFSYIIECYTENTTHNTRSTVCLCTHESWMSVVPLHLKCLVSQGLYFRDVVPS